jgi:hypothetical protein
MAQKKDKSPKREAMGKPQPSAANIICCTDAITG